LPERGPIFARAAQPDAESEYHPRVIFFVIMVAIAIGAVIVLIRMK